MRLYLVDHARHIIEFFSVEARTEIQHRPYIQSGGDFVTNSHIDYSAHLETMYMKRGTIYSLITL